MRTCFFILLLLSNAGFAWAGDEAACAAQIGAVERSVPVPARALQSIALVESGRLVGNRLAPWPWSVSAGGVGRYYASKAEAISQVEALQTAGLHSIDVGCMQVNLASHPDAFRSLEDAFDPAANVAYAARFLLSLYQQTGRWTVALTAYHSQTPSLAADYARRLLAVWPEAARLGLTASKEPGQGRSPPPQLDDSSERSRLLQAALPVHGQAWPVLLH